MLSTLFLTTSCNQDNNFFPDNEGVTWTYKIILSSDYTGSNKEKRLSVTNVKTVIQGKGTTYSRVYSNGDMITFFKDKHNKSLSRVAAYLTNNNGFDEPVERILFPSVDFKINEWKIKNQLFITKGFQPPLRDFVPSVVFDMSYKLISSGLDLKVKAGNFNDCVYIKGIGNTNFIADTRSGPNEVNIISEEWFCPKIGLVKEKRVESTNASAFGSQSYYKELISFKN